LQPEEVDVEVYYGPVDSDNVIMESHVEPMVLQEKKGDGACVYTQEVVCGTTGRFGFTARVTPQGSDWKDAMPGFMTWADGAKA
jgi:starch phosphorylase